MVTDVLPVDQDLLAVSFWIYFGKIGQKKTALLDDNKQEVWIHLYPAAEPGSRLDMQIQAYGLGGDYVCKYDGDTIGRILYRCAGGFALLGKSRWSKSKLVALAKYYFLAKLAELGNEADAKKLQLGIPVGKSFKDELKTVCREFKEEETRKSKALRSSVSKRSMSMKSDLSEIQPERSELEIQEADSGVMIEDTLSSTMRVTDTSHNITNTKEDVVEAMLGLHKKGEEVMEDAAELEQKITRLERELKMKNEGHGRIEMLKEEILTGLSPKDVFALGQEVERVRAQKRRKLSRYMQQGSAN